MNILKKYTYQIIVAAAYVAAMLFFMFGIGTECYYIMQHPAFLTDWAFFKDFLPIPGGVGAYLSLFVEQYFYIKFWGGFMLTFEILIAAALLNMLIKRVLQNNITAKSLLWLLPLFISVMCANSVYFAFQIITQLIVMLTIMNILHHVGKDNKMFSILLFAAALMVYHFCGPLYLYCFCVSEIIILFLTNSSQKLLNSAVVLVVAIFYPAILYRFFLPLTPKFIFYYPVTERIVLELFQPIIASFYILVPLAVVIQYFINKADFVKIKKIGKKDKKSINTAPFYYAGVCALMLVTLIIVYNIDDQKRERFSAKISFEAEAGHWDYVINNSGKIGVYDRNINFYFDMALALTGQMSNHLFDYPQLLGSEGLLLDEPLAGIICYPTSTLYFNLGQLSNSLRYAYESINYYKDSPYILRRIIDCLIISKHYTEAEIFLKELSRNMMAKNFIKDRMQFIKEGNSKNIPIEYVRQKQELAVKWDYIMSPPFRNFEQMMLSNGNNIPATDYILCYCLLENDLENFVNALLASRYNIKNLPKHYQEALMVYLSNTANPNPKIREAVIDNGIKQRYAQFATIVNNGGENAYRLAKQNFANTYWTYYAFENPMSKNFSLKKSQQ